MTDLQPDVLIIGAGVGGGSAAWALVQRGFRVLIFEKGHQPDNSDYLLYDELHFSEHKSLTPPINSDANVYHTNGQTRMVQRWWVNNAVGGSSNIWESNLIRYSGPDFTPASTLNDDYLAQDMPDWPWSYDDFQPYYEQAEWDWGVSGQINQSPSQETFRDNYDYPMPPITQHPGDETLKSIFNNAGYYPYQGPKGINSQYRDERPECPFCGFCQGFGCAVNDRASARNTVIEKAKATGLCEVKTGHYATRIHHQDGKVQGAYYRTTPESEEYYQPANKVIVATQADQSARLFLLSDIPDPHQLIGHYLTYHTKGGLEVVFPDLPPWSRNGENDSQNPVGLGTLQIRDLYNISDPSSSLSIGGKFSVYDPYTIGTPISLVNRTGLWGKELIEHLQGLRQVPGAGFSFTGIALSQYDNRVELDPNVTDPWGIPVVRSYYQHHEYDQQLSRYALDTIAHILEQGGGKIIKKRPQGPNNSGYGHMHGTLRAGHTPETSVLDTNCQSHAVQGLYALDASWMPTSGASNPSLTIIANAYRVCATMPQENT